jgi:hypothetical protein
MLNRKKLLSPSRKQARRSFPAALLAAQRTAVKHGVMRRTSMKRRIAERMARPFKSDLLPFSYRCNSIAGKFSHIP